MKNAIRLYSLLLSLYPRSYRQAFGAQMLQTFVDHYKDMGRPDGLVNLDFWLSFGLDEIQNIARQHVTDFTDTHAFLKVTVTKLAVSAIFIIPFYLAFCLLLVNLSLALPHPHVSGLGAIVALGVVLLVLPLTFSLGVSYVLASALVSLFPKRKVRLG